MDRLFRRHGRATTAAEKGQTDDSCQGPHNAPAVSAVSSEPPAVDPQTASILKLATTHDGRQPLSIRLPNDPARIMLADTAMIRANPRVDIHFPGSNHDPALA